MVTTETSVVPKDRILIDMENQPLTRDTENECFTNETESSAPQSTANNNDNMGETICSNSSTIAREFTRQYYSIFNEKRDCCYRFYSNNSLLARNGKSYGGQSGIQKYFASLDQQHCHVSIILVDSSETYDHGILVHVFGDLYYQNEPIRRFVQVFVLALQKDQKRYYVLNDTMRFFDEILQYKDYMDAGGKRDTNASVTVDDSPIKANVGTTDEVIANGVRSTVIDGIPKYSEENSAQSTASIMDAKAAPFVPAIEVCSQEQSDGLAEPIERHTAELHGGESPKFSSNCLADNSLLHEKNESYQEVDQRSSNDVTVAVLNCSAAADVVASSSPVQLSTPSVAFDVQAALESSAMSNVNSSGAVSYALVAGGSVAVKPLPSSAPIVNAAYNVPQLSAHPGLVAPGAPIGPYAYQLAVQEFQVCNGAGTILSIPVMTHNAIVNGGNAHHTGAALYSHLDYMHAGGHLPPATSNQLPTTHQMALNVPPHRLSHPQPSAFERQIYVRDFPMDATYEELAQYFSKFGNVTDVTIKCAQYPADGRFAFITFERPDTVNQIIQSAGINQHQLRNCILKIEKKKPYDSKMLRNRTYYPRWTGCASSMSGNLPLSGQQKHVPFKPQSGNVTNVYSGSVSPARYSNPAMGNYVKPGGAAAFNAHPFQHQGQKGPSGGGHRGLMNG